jgi:hypothetical protein
MTIRLLAILLLCTVQQSFAQFTDNFSDGDYTAGPVWTPSAPTDFVVSAGQQLQSNNTTASSTFYISTPSATATNCQWEFFVNLKLATSGTNYTDIYLTADNADLTNAALNGYFVRIGNTLDEICLYKNTAGTSAKIIDGADGIVASSSNNLIKIKVTRDVANLFTLYRDMSGTGGSYTSEGTVTDVAFTTSAFFGVLIKQSTATFFQKHFFDDFYVGPIVTDVTPPTLTSATPVSATQLDVLFNENLDAITSQTAANYSVNNGVGTPSSAVLDGTDLRLVHLTFATSFTNGLQNSITVNGVQDVAGNAIIGGTANFTYLSFSIPTFKDVIINELMVDVNPVPAGVPAKQYLELYNRSSNYLNLNGWQFSDAVSTATVTVSYTLAPNSYVLIAKSSDTALFTGITNKIGTATFPTYNTSGDPVYLRDNAATVIDSISYTPAWYNDAVKDDGGWSLELINPSMSAGCSAQSNWTASNNASGGTPGVQNSVYSTTPDVTGPSVVGITTIDSVTAEVCFNEAIGSALISNTANYSASGGLGSPSNVVVSPDLKCATLTFAASFTSSTTYTLSFSSLADCSGNTVNPGSGTFVYIQLQAPAFGDVIINEIMVDVNPVPVGVPAKQYIELYNRSTKFFNLNGWKFSDAVSTTTVTTAYTLAPGTYVLIAKSADTALFTGISNKIGTATFPAYNTTGDPVYLRDGSSALIDSIRYTTAWYNDAVKDDGGWSLELINPNLGANCVAQNNWTASNNTNGGTPGVQNSVYNTTPDVTSPQLQSILVLDSVTLQVCFNEAISASLISNAANYSASSGLGNPVTAIAAGDLKCVTLTYATPFTSLTTYTLTFASLADCSGNTISPGSGTFTYVQIQPPVAGDVIITEIMVDVNPLPASVPAKQYIEIYNKSSRHFNVNGWTFADAASTSTIAGNYIFAPNTYLLIAKSTDTALFTGIANKVASSTFPSYNLTGDPVYIYDNAGNLLDSIHYTTAWYNDAVKDDGGWSLERINPSLSQNCLAQSNWTASNDPAGGTPGVQNSVYSTTPDLTSPQFASVTVLDSVTLELCFNEAISTTLANNTANYIVNNGIGSPSSILTNATQSCMTLSFVTPFTSQTAYTISFTSLADCSGNIVSPTNAAFTYYQLSNPAFNDVIVTELMIDVNPAPVAVPAKQYLELYNKSGKYFNLNNWQFSDLVGSVSITSNYLLAPGTYVVLAKAADTALFVGVPNKIGLSSFPSYNTTGDGVYVQDGLGNFVDSLRYTDDWYRNTAQKAGGWSLELINPTLNSNCEIADNWKGTFSPNGGTPGVQNSVYSVAPDVTGPQPLQVSVSDSLHVTLCFDEAISANLISDITHYLISAGIGNPLSAVVSAGSSKCIDMVLGAPLQDQTNYTMTFTGLTDCSNNTVSPASVSFSYYAAKPYDVVINELFADPDPQVALPNGEYIELYNRSTYAVSLKDWTLTIGNNDILLPDAVIYPDSFVVLIDDAAQNDFINQGFGNRPLVVVPELSSNELNVSDEDVMLRDKSNTIISYVHYDDSWYADNVKKEGGWSLEQVDPNNPCAGSSNWRASNNPAGGTPGITNSIHALNPDNSAPQLLRVNVINADTIMALFDESMQYASLLPINSWSVSNGIGTPVAIYPQPQDYKKCLVVLAAPLQTNTIYTLTVSSTVYDCAGNAVSTENSARFGLPQLPVANDVVINELLFNPKVNGVDYVELYNRSDKIIDLADLYIGEGSATGTIIDDSVRITQDGYLLFPGEYVLLSENGGTVKSQYYSENPKWFLDMEDLPSMNSDADVVVIADVAGTEIDKVSYTDDMHFALLNDPKGVSLERIDFERPSTDATNWNSAAANVGFGTPAYRNSQYLQTQSTGSFSVSPEVFSPDNDGYNDVVTINYTTSEPGLAGNVTIYDSRGVFVRYLVKNENLATSGSYSWNGINAQNEKAPMGIYIIYFETFSPTGKTEKHKLTCVLAGKL